MQSLLIFGGVWFWILAIASMICITAFIEKEETSGLGANITLLVTGLLLYFCGNQSSMSGFLGYIFHNPGMDLLFFLLYVIIGAGWIVFKWWLFLLDARQRIIDRDESYWASEFSPGNHKSRLTHWGIYWPFSAFWTLINNPARRAFRYIVSSLTGTLQSISDRVMSSVKHKERKKSL